jgi:hypothetical protein
MVQDNSSPVKIEKYEKAIFFVYIESEYDNLEKK